MEFQQQSAPKLQGLARRGGSLLLNKYSPQSRSNPKPSISAQRWHPGLITASVFSMRARYLLLVAALFSTLLATPAQAISSQVISIDAPWVYLNAADLSSTKITKNPVKRTYSAEKSITKSSFIVDFTNTPESYRSAISAAVDVWSQYFASQVPVKVEVLWERQASAGNLAAASPGKFHSNFKNIPDKDLWYSSALADALAGEDIEPTIPEVTIRINSTNGPMLYLGTDGNCPRNKYDLMSMILHEMSHGLGFLSNSDYDDLYGYGSIQRPTPFDAYAQLADGRRLMDLDSPSLELGRALTEPLVWSGANGVRANNGIKPPLYTPKVYETGSSVSHLDEASFLLGTSNSVMTPNLQFGEVFHDPGPLLIAMFEDLLAKPPAGLPYGLPGVPRNVKALVGNRSAILTFDPPTNQRTAQVSSYVVTINQTGTESTVTQSPAVISGLVNGSTYSFSISAKNEVGLSTGATTNGVIPQSLWKKKVVDANADGQYFATGVFAGKKVIAYADSQHGLLKLATWDGKKWNKQVVDGDSTIGGRTQNSVASALSICTYKAKKTEFLNLYYGDLSNKDLRRASFNGKRWSYEVIDGDGATIQDYREVDRVRTASDVSVANACAITSAGEQVFYRDESQGILLGAVRDGKDWRYEIVDGDNLNDGRTMGDVGFHLKAKVVGQRINLIYDSILQVSNADKSALRGDVRIATRESAYPEDWKYQAVAENSEATAVAGYNVALAFGSNILHAAWFGAAAISLPKPDQIQWSRTGINASPDTAQTDYFGTPNGPIAVDNSGIIFGCEERLCAYNKLDQTINLISSANSSSTKSAGWITLNKRKYALAANNGKLTLFKRP